MRVTQKMVDAVMRVTGVNAIAATEAMRQVADLIDPVPADVLAIRDANGALWRRMSDDISAGIWQTVGRRSVVSSFTLAERFGPLKFEARDPR